MTKERKARVSWTEEEIGLLARETARRRLEDPLPTLTALLAQAEEAALPADRRRGLNTILQAPRLLEKTMAALALLKAERQVVEVPVAIEVPVEIEAGKLAGELTDAELIHESAKRFAAFLKLLRIDLDQTKLVAIGTAPAPRTVVAQAPEARDRKPRVAIAGLLSGQFEQVKEKCRDLGFDLSYVDKDKHQFAAGRVDRMVVVARFISHKKVEEMEASPALKGRIIVLPPNSGITGVCKALADLKSKLGMENGHGR